MSLELARLPATRSRPALRVVLATTGSQRRACRRLRADIYVEELGIIDADHPFVGPEGLRDPYDDWSLDLLLLAGEEPAGTVRVTRAADGALELAEYADLSGLPEALPGFRAAAAAELTRFMVRRSWRRTAAGPLLALAAWRVLRRSGVRWILVAGKEGNLGRYYQNAGLERVAGAPPFTYGLTGCRYELLATDVGAPASLRRLAWGSRVLILAFLALRLGGRARGVLRRGFTAEGRPRLAVRP